MRYIFKYILSFSLLPIVSTIVAIQDSFSSVKLSSYIEQFPIFYDPEYFVINENNGSSTFLVSVKEIDKLTMKIQYP
jgi:hypothetical protein